MRPIHFRAGGRTLAGRVFGPATERAGILFVHGIDSSQSGYWERAEAAVERLGAVCLTFDLGGHGQSAGSRPTLSIRDHLEDVTAAYDRLVAERDVDPGRVGVVGASYGGYLATLLTTRRAVARLALRAPALYDDSAVGVPRALRGRSDEPPAASAALESLRRFRGAVLIVESENDESVLPATTAAYRDVRPDAEHVVIANAGHELSQPEWRKAFLSALLDFFAEL